jgi:fimbrial chaperone protein
MASRHTIAMLAALAMASSFAHASGLQVSPVSLSLQPTQNADGLWLSNSGDALVRAQVRVYHWTQEGGEEQLEPSRGLVISPPMLQLDPQGKQLIRVIRAAAPPRSGASEDAYRIAIDELPTQDPEKKGLQFVLHYSVPVFVEPTGANASPPQLHWTLRRDGERAVLEVANAGGTHAQLAGLAFVDASGHRTEVSAGLLGYVLPGATMRWVLKPPATTFADGGTLEGKVNGDATTQNVTLVDRAR